MIKYAPNNIVSITNLRRNPRAVIKKASIEPVLLMDRTSPIAVIVPLSMVENDLRDIEKADRLNDKAFFEEFSKDKKSYWNKKDDKTLKALDENSIRRLKDLYPNE